MCLLYFDDNLFWGQRSWKFSLASKHYSIPTVPPLPPILPLSTPIFSHPTTYFCSPLIVVCLADSLLQGWRKVSNSGGVHPKKWSAPLAPPIPPTLYWDLFVPLTKIRLMLLLQHCLSKNWKIEPSPLPLYGVIEPPFPFASRYSNPYLPYTPVTFTFCL